MDTNEDKIDIKMKNKRFNNTDEHNGFRKYMIKSDNFENKDKK